MSGSCRLGTDIGGTFTDVVLMTEDGTVYTKKVLSTKNDYGEAVLTAAGSLLRELELDPLRVDAFLHGTTVATNAVLQRSAPPAGLITTRGFRDVLELRRLRFPELYNIFWEKPEPLVARRHRLEVAERMAADGSVVTALDESEVRTAAERFRQEGISSIAVCLLNSYANPEHEQTVKRILQEFGLTFVCASADVLPEIKEYERTSTTVLNAYLMPVVHDYIHSLETKLKELGIKESLLLMQSNGGMMTATQACQRPVHILESGPAAGVTGGVQLADELGLDKLITFDMGGTTAKASIIEDGDAYRTPEYEVGAPISVGSRVLKGGGYLVRVPAIDVAEVGAGGGSIVWIDPGGAIQIGPQSAGADPGPVCYGRGGTQPTVTDANVVLGYLNPSALLSGELPIDWKAAADAIQTEVADKLGLDLLEAAYAVHVVANASMGRALRAVSTERGRDPEEFSLLAFGGNGPVHGPLLASALGIRKVILPPSPGVFSAMGLLLSEVEHDFIKTVLARIDQLDSAAINAMFEPQELQAAAVLAEEGFAGDSVRFQRQADMRYVGQSHALTVNIPDASHVTGPADLRKAFEDEHQATYGHVGVGEPVEVINLRVIGRGNPGRSQLESVKGMVAVDRNQGSNEKGDQDLVHREVYFGRGTLVRAPVIPGRGGLRNGKLLGPAIIEEYDATIVVPPGATAELDRLGNVILTLTPDSDH